MLLGLNVTNASPTFAIGRRDRRVAARAPADAARLQRGDGGGVAAPDARRPPEHPPEETAAAAAAAVRRPRLRLRESHLQLGQLPLHEQKRAYVLREHHRGDFAVVRHVRGSSSRLASPDAASSPLTATV